MVRQSFIPHLSSPTLGEVRAKGEIATSSYLLLAMTYHLFNFNGNRC